VRLRHSARLEPVRPYQFGGVACKASAGCSQRETDRVPLHFVRHQPYQTRQYHSVQEHEASFLAHTEDTPGGELPRFIKDEFDAHLKSGILAHGFLQLRRRERGYDKLLACPFERLVFRTLRSACCRLGRN